MHLQYVAGFGAGAQDSQRQNATPGRWEDGVWEKTQSKQGKTCIKVESTPVIVNWFVGPRHIHYGWVAEKTNMAGTVLGLYRYQYCISYDLLFFIWLICDEVLYSCRVAPRVMSVPLSEKTMGVPGWQHLRTIGLALAYTVSVSKFHSCLLNFPQSYPTNQIGQAVQWVTLILCAHS